MKKAVKVTKSIEYDRLKCLLIAAYLLGQEQGLNGKTYSHPESVRQRENLINFMSNGMV